MSGNLYIISVPIGNPQDMSPRALDQLRALDLVACEDTRDFARYCTAWGISFDKPLISLNDVNERKRTPELIQALQEGRDVGLVVSRGTPAVSDPGYILIREAIGRGVTLYTLPGPSAVINALVLSGLPPDKFIFLGFPPRKPGQQKNFFKKYADLEITLIFFESPYRVIKTLKNICDLFPKGHVAVCREMTKTYEEVIRGSFEEVLQVLGTKKELGEVTVVISP